MSSYKVDRSDLLQKISTLVSQEVFSSVDKDDTAADYRSKGDEFALIMGRITAVLIAEKIDASIVFDIQNWVVQTQSSVFTEISRKIRPGGEISKILSGSELPTRSD
ncbi:hypothetical protein ABQX22_13730 [Xanthomonas sp. WHRI 1810A]|uniref:hypothetical protein n=1 Tax=Xanthomonas sp. WHRI 1810A TaxID=3161565 RepID=UPI0032E8595F